MWAAVGVGVGAAIGDGLGAADVGSATHTRLGTCPDTFFYTEVPCPYTWVAEPK